MKKKNILHSTRIGSLTLDPKSTSRERIRGSRRNLPANRRGRGGGGTLVFCLKTDLGKISPLCVCVSSIGQNTGGKKRGKGR